MADKNAVRMGQFTVNLDKDIQLELKRVASVLQYRKSYIFEDAVIFYLNALREVFDTRVFDAEPTDEQRKVHGSQLSRPKEVHNMFKGNYLGDPLIREMGRPQLREAARQSKAYREERDRLESENAALVAQLEQVNELLKKLKK